MKVEINNSSKTLKFKVTVDDNFRFSDFKVDSINFNLLEKMNRENIKL